MTEASIPNQEASGTVALFESHLKTTSIILKELIWFNALIMPYSPINAEWTSYELHIFR